MKRVAALFLGTLILLSFEVYSDNINHVYSAGQDGSSNAVLWINSLNGSNSQEIKLPTSGSGKCLNIAVSSSSVYIAGQDGPDGSGNAALWISNLNGINPQEVILPTSAGNGYAAGVAIPSKSSSLVYTVGYDRSSSMAVLWMYNSAQGALVKKFTLPTTTSKSVAQSVASSLGCVYIVGQDGQNSSSDATLWICNLDGTKVKEVFLTNDAVGAYATGVAISSNNVYSVGSDGSNSVLWIGTLDNKGYTTAGTTKKVILPISSGGNANSVAVSSNSIYIVGSDGTSNGVLWISNLDGTGTITKVSLPTTGAGSNALGVATTSSSVYSSGSNGIRSVLWISVLDGNGSTTAGATTEIPLESGVDDIDAAAYGVAVSSLSPANVLVEDLVKYSPFIPLIR